MNRPDFDDIKFFIGTEVEHTPAFGKKTLFVVGVQDIADIEDMLNDPFTKINTPVEHIYFGANQSFPMLDENDYVNWSQWETMIDHFLQAGFLCTLDIDVQCVEGLLESGLVENHNFLPMISVKLPYIQQLGYNATIKLDDLDFAKTNPGVWCHSLHDLQRRDKFTPWNQYTKDKKLK
jgi:hypothetical protein